MQTSYIYVYTCNIFCWFYDESRVEWILVLLFQARCVSLLCARGCSFRRSKLSENLHSWCAERHNAGNSIARGTKLRPTKQRESAKIVSRVRMDPFSLSLIRGCIHRCQKRSCLKVIRTYLSQRTKSGERDWLILLSSPQRDSTRREVNTFLQQSIF